MDLVRGPKNTAPVISPEKMARACDLKQRPRKTESGSAGQDGAVALLPIAPLTEPARALAPCSLHEIRVRLFI